MNRNNLRWEQVHGPVKTLEFMRAWNDPEIPLMLIVHEFHMSATHQARDLADRLKAAGNELIDRPKANRGQATKELPPAVTLETLTAEEEALQARLKEIEAKKLDMLVSVERKGPNEVWIAGLAEGVICTTADFVRNFLDGNGPSKMRDAVGRLPVKKP